MGNTKNKAACKNVGDMLHIFYGDISDKNILDQFKIDTIVNAAKPTLMDSTQGVDGAIHRKIDALLKNADSLQDFNGKIREELDKEEIRSHIRCRRGHAVMTRGYGLCDHVIHVVGSIFDIEPQGGQVRSYAENALRHFEICSSSRIRTLEACYYEIVKLIKECPDIRNVAIPIIGSGEYRFPFEMAVKIAFSSIGNALLEWQREDGEYFNITSEGLQNVIFFVWKREENERKKAEEVLKQYKEIFAKGEQVVWQNSLKAQLQYLMEIIRYDETRGYFCVAKIARIMLAIVRLFSGYTYLKDWKGGHSWQKRRLWVELTVFLKVLAAILLILIFRADVKLWEGILIFPAICILFYNMADTTTYLISLLMMADIQKPSANIIRSLLLLLLNYMEVSLEITGLYFRQYRERGITLLEALEPGLIGGTLEQIKMTEISDYILHYGNTVLKFFFVTMVFGYLSGHMRQRQFRS